MLIDWFTVGAQALNFIILVWLLKRYLYKPIINAVDAREKRITAELADADSKRTEAKKERDEFEHKNEEFDQQRANLLEKVMEEAKTERERLLDDARTAADALSSKRQEAVRSDAVRLSQAISQRTQQEVFSIARKALTDLADTSLEERIIEVFICRLRSIDGKEKAAFGKALKTASEPVLVRSAFDLPEAQRLLVMKALNETFPVKVQVQFETASDQVGGIAVTASGQKVAWSISDYLASLAKGVGELLQAKDKPEAKAGPKPGPKVAPKKKAGRASKPKASKSQSKSPKPKATQT